MRTCIGVHEAYKGIQRAGFGAITLAITTATLPRCTTHTSKQRIQRHQFAANMQAPAYAALLPPTGNSAARII